MNIKADMFKLLGTFVDPCVAALADSVADVQQTFVFSVAAAADVFVKWSYSF